MDRLNGLGTLDGDMKDPKMDLCSIIKCEQCLFWCSDPRYITLHNEIAHGTTANDTKDLLSHPSAKKFKAEQTELALDPKNKANIEQMIKLTHSLMSHLYSTLLDCSVTENENDVSSILERVVPDSTQQTSSHLLNSTLNNSNSLNFTDQEIVQSNCLILQSVFSVFFPWLRAENIICMSYCRYNWVLHVTAC